MLQQAVVKKVRTMFPTLSKPSRNQEGLALVCNKITTHSSRESMSCDPPSIYGALLAVEL